MRAPAPRPFPPSSPASVPSAHPGNDDQALRDILGRGFGTSPPRHSRRLGQDCRLIQRRPSRKQLLRLGAVTLQREVFEALAGQQDDQMFEQS